MAIFSNSTLLFVFPLPILPHKQPASMYSTMQAKGYFSKCSRFSENPFLSFSFFLYPLNFIYLWRVFLVVKSIDRNSIILYLYSESTRRGSMGNSLSPLRISVIGGGWRRRRRSKARDIPAAAAVRVIGIRHQGGLLRPLLVLLGQILGRPNNLKTNSRIKQ